MKAQMGLPDMKLPIQYAFTYPERWKTDFPRFNFMDYPELTFEAPDRNTFVNLDLAYQVMEKEGTAACVLNAANEVSVQLFLEEKIGFLDIARINQRTVDKASFVLNPSYEDFVSLDLEARKIAFELA